MSTSRSLAARLSHLPYGDGDVISVAETKADGDEESGAIWRPASQGGESFFRDLTDFRREEAFRAYARHLADNCLLPIDTYTTLLPKRRHTGSWECSMSQTRFRFVY
jgi:hypothetical protein